MDTLQVNASFAAIYERSGKLAQEQRKAELLKSVRVPLRVLRALVHTFKGLLKGESHPICAATPSSVALEVLRRHNLGLDDDAEAEYGAALRVPLNAGVGHAVDAFLDVGGKGRSSVAKLLRWSRGRAHTQRMSKGGEAHDAGGVHIVCQSATAKVERPSISPSPPLIFLASPLSTSSPSLEAPPIPDTFLRRSKPRGRGSGRGRGLGPKGEPLFEELHFSWRCRRVEASRQRKLIHRDLWKGSANGTR